MLLRQIPQRRPSNATGWRLKRFDYSITAFVSLHLVVHTLSIGFSFTIFRGRRGRYMDVGARAS